MSTAHRATAPCVASTPASMLLPVLAKNWPASLPATLRAFLRPPAAAEGTLGRAAHILRALFRRARARARASAFPLHHRVRARMARCSTRGPLRGGESGTTGRAAGESMDGFALFARARCPLEKPGPGSRTCRAGEGMDARVEATPGAVARCPASAKRGVVFSWLLLFWTSKREVTRASQAHESSCL